MGRRFKNLAALAAQAAHEKKGEQVTLFHVRPKTSLTDYLLLVSVNSPAHLDAVEQKISDALKTKGANLLHHDGSHSRFWRVLDYGGLMVHLMHPEARGFYALDKLYAGASKVRWNQNNA